MNAKKLRIIFLTQWFDPEPGFKGLLFARELHSLGHEVEVITGFPNYPGGKLYPGFKQRLIQRESIGGVAITRVPLYPSHDGSAIKRILNYVSFAATSCLYGVFGAKKADVIYVYHPPMTVGLSGAMIALLRRTPFVYDVQDLWPDTLRATGMINNDRVLSVVAKGCAWIYKRAAHIAVLSPGFQKLMIERGVDAAKISVIYNWCDERSMQVPQATKIDLAFMDGKFNVVFAGNMGKAQALESVLEAAASMAGSDSEVQFVFVGGGVQVEHLKQFAVQLGTDNVRFLARMEMSEVGAVLAKADALLVHLRDDPLFEITIPSKTQAYLAVGKPIIMGVYGDAAKLIEQAAAGVAVTPENPQSIADGIRKISHLTSEQRAQMGQNAVAFYQRELSLKVGVGKFSELFEGVALKSFATKKGKLS